MYTIVSDRYGFGTYDDPDDIILLVDDLDYCNVHLTHLLCACGELIHGLVDCNYDIVAVETEHLHHMGW
jgi:hypothetical protein